MKLLIFFESLIKPFDHTEHRAPPKTLFKFYWHYIRQAKGLFIALLIIGGLSSLLEIALFQFIGKIIDIIQSVHSPSELFSQHKGAFLWMLFVIVILRPLVALIHDLLINQAITTNFTSMIRWQQHRHVIKQSMNFFNSSFSGGIANRIMNTGQSIRNSTMMSADSMWRVSIYTIMTIVLFSSLNIWLIVPIILWVIGYILMLRYFLPKTQKRSHQSAKARSKLMGHMVDSYGHIAILKLFSHTEREEAHAKEMMQHQTEMALRSTRLITGLDITLNILNSLLIASVVILSLLLWERSLITAGDIAFTLSLTIRINTMSSWVMRVVNHIFEDLGSVQDGIKIITHPHDITDTKDAKTLTVQKGEISFSHVAFGYHKEKPIYHDFNLTIQAGEKIGLVGPSGAGKSTFIALLLRLYDIQHGSISIDGTDITQVTQDSLRANIGVVTQDTTLLHRSIRDNLLYGNPSATDEMLYDVLKQTKADIFVKDLIDQYGNQGLDALVGENGVKLSGGQRQRIAIARVLLKNAPILVLDEATSALDSESEAVIQENLEVLMENKTVIAIAHRLSTIAKMDRLIVLENGKITEEGTHDALVKQNGIYASLWQRQAI